MIQLTDWQEKKIQAVLNVFENTSVNNNYDAIATYNDGKDQRKQVTLGIGFTEDSGSLGRVLNVYQDVNGIYSRALSQYIANIGKGTNKSTILADNNLFKDLLQAAARNDMVFRECQDFVYRALYVHPARRYAEKEGLIFPLSILIVQDSILHGSIDTVRKLFSEVTPAKGGDEKKWAKAYCEARLKWLPTVSDLLAKTVYRPKCFLDAIERGNWDLSLPINANGVKV